MISVISQSTSIKAKSQQGVLASHTDGDKVRSIRRLITGSAKKSVNLYFGNLVSKFRHFSRELNTCNEKPLIMKIIRHAEPFVEWKRRKLKKTFPCFQTKNLHLLLKYHIKILQRI
jgi:hypothetical protein